VEKVSVLVPTRQRYKKLAKCLTKLFENTVYPNWEVVVITDKDDPESIDIIKKLPFIEDENVKIFTKEKREMYVGKINEGYHKTDSPLIVFLADDVEVQPNWLTEAVKTFNESFSDKMGLVSFQDEFDNKIAPHGLISRKYVDEYLDGNIFYPGYVHYWCDTELTVRSKRWGRFAHSPKSVTIHRSREGIDDYGKDDDHIRREARTTLKQGENMLIFRQATGFSDEIPASKHYELPKKVVVRFIPTEEMSFYKGFGVDTREKLDWEVDRETALFLLKNFSIWFTTPVLEREYSQKKKRMEKLKILACLCVYNEMDILPNLLDHLKSQDIDVFVFDNYSTDGTWEYLKKNGIDYEKLDTGEKLDLGKIIEAKMRKWNEVKPDWCIYQDADEFPLTSEFSTLRELIEDRDKKGFDVINQLRVTFLPVGEEIFDGKSPRETFHYYDKNYWFSSTNACSDRIFKYKKGIRLSGGAHHILFSLRRSKEGLDNVIFHYPYREFAKRQVEERKSRSLESEVKRGLHKHYFESYPKGFIWSKEGKGDIRNFEDPLHKFYEKWEIEETKKIAEGIQGWVSDREGAYLFQKAKDCSKGIIIEIGSWKGKSTIWLGKGSKIGNKIRIYAIDPFDGRDSKFITIPQPDYSVFEIFKDNIEKAGLDGLITPIVSRSQDTSEKIKEGIELLFIDGAHEYEFVKKDFELYFPKVIKGGIIAFHDANEKRVFREGVIKLIEELSKRQDIEKVKTVDSIISWRKVC